MTRDRQHQQVQHRLRAQDAHAKELSDLRRELHQLRRKNAQLRKQLQKYVDAATETETVATESPRNLAAAAEIPAPTALACGRCGGVALKFTTPSGKEILACTVKPCLWRQAIGKD